MDLIGLNYYCLDPLLEELAKQQKTAFLLEDFNVDVLKNEEHNKTD